MSKHRLLFVDDEALVLQGLSRAFRPMRHVWDVDFATSGSMALHMMAATKYDAIVTDICMPEVNGLELLDLVKQQHPGVIRIVLSGQADEEKSARAAGATHQYLMKPCESQQLQQTIKHALARRDGVDNVELRTLVARLDRLPSLPTLYKDIIAHLQHPEASLRTIGKIIAKDMAMTAKLLQLVNSPFFGLSRKVANPAHACQLLGLATVKALVLTTKIFAEFESLQVQRIDLKVLWRHSLSVGSRARRMADSLRCSRSLAEEAFTAGLLHDIGKLIVSTNLPVEYEEVASLIAEGDLAPHQAEKEVFNTTHAEVGAYLADLWGLPHAISEGIANHHFPDRGEHGNLTPATLVHVADYLDHEMTHGRHQTEVELNADHLERLAIGDQLQEWKEMFTRLEPEAVV